jgi:hypothetical protein
LQGFGDFHTFAAEIFLMSKGMKENYSERFTAHFAQGYIRLQRDLLSVPEVADMYAKEGATGLGLYVAINLYLSHCEGGWGVYNGKRLSAIAVEAHRHRSDVLRMKKIKWSTVKKVLQVLVTIISTVIGTVAVQASVL